MNDQAVVVSPTKAGEIIEAVIARGDLAQLNPQERAKYYSRVCESIGINPLTKPFEYITLNGKLTLYARKDCTDQLRKIYGVSVEDMNEVREADLIIVTVKVRDKTGRSDMAKGAVTLKNLAGEALANAIMKAETKAKRRATLSICGLGFLDETEVETVSNAHTPRLPKKDARDIYSRLQAEVDQAADIEAWLLQNEGRLLVLPEDWENILRLRIQERQQTPMPPAEEVVWTEPEDGTPPEWSNRCDDLGPVKQAGILCAEEGFQKFLIEKELVTDADKDTPSVVRRICGVTSRKDLSVNAAAEQRWRQLVADYRAWQREPSVIEDQVSPQASPAANAAGPDSPHPPQTGPAAPIPTAAEYHEQWKTMIDAATNAEQIRTAWNAQAAERQQIEWTKEHPFKPLQKKIANAIEFLERS